MQFKIKVQPNSSRQEIIFDLEGNPTKVYLTKPAIDGKANSQLEKFLSKQLKTPVKIIKGHTSKNKIIEIQNG